MEALQVCVRKSAVFYEKTSVVISKKSKILNWPCGDDPKIRN